MVKDHPDFEKPDEPHTTLWRYVDFTKYVQLLDTGALFFARADRLGDPFEGTISQANIDLRPEVYPPELNTAQAVRQIACSRKAWPRFICISCWHMSEHESAAMWKLHLKSNEGVAIRSTYARLVEALSKTDEIIYTGRVRYVDYQKNWVPEGTVFAPFMHKRRSFEHEKEFRAIIWARSKRTAADAIDLSVDVVQDGIAVPVIKETLIEAVYVAPGSPSWYKDLVMSITAKYLSEVPVHQSALDAPPLY